MPLLAYLNRHAKGLAVAALLAGTISGVSSAALIGLISQQLSKTAPITWSFIGLFSALILFSVVTSICAKWLLVRFSAQITYALRLELVKRILHTPFRQLEMIGSSTLLGSLVEDVRTVTVTLNQLPTLCINLTIIVGCTIYLAWLSPPIFALLTVLALPTYLLHQQLHQRGKATMRVLLAMRDQRDRYLADLIQGIKELQLNRRRRIAFVTELLEPNLHAMMQQMVDARLYHALAQSMSQSAYFISIFAILISTHLVSIDLMLLTSYALTALYMKNAVNQVLQTIPQWTEALLAIQKIEGLHLIATEEILDTEKAQPLTHATHFQLSLASITHSYTLQKRSDPFVLGPLTLCFAAGELVFITGANGSGKTTLMKLLAGLYTPEHGQLQLDHQLITAKNQQEYREHISVVFSDFHLFEQLLGFDESTLADATMDYLAKLALEEKVSVVQGRLSTLDLSQGQRKRLALLTAYLEDRPIYLFDEWAANQDPRFKAYFYQQLLPELAARGKLVIAITHDDQYFHLADRVLHLENGQLIDKPLRPLQKFNHTLSNEYSGDGPYVVS